MRCRGIASVELDGRPVDPAAIPLADDGLAHGVRVVLGPERGITSGLAQSQARPDAVGTR
ncbi:MAG: hypothetical protein NDJ92_14240 [Thermoanaerobaculia bacterium]|nr:hypothetical protein [Thermoanaerobaculia bacterium]